MVSAEIVEIYENKDLAEKFGAMSVPKTFINGKNTSEGLEPAERFLDSLLLGRRAEESTIKIEKHKDVFDLVILGAGPAGLTAAIYAQRSGLSTLVLEKQTIGGQIAITPLVENYPGYPKIAGKALVEMMTKQALQYVDIEQGVEISDIKIGGGFELATSSGPIRCRSLILATGASHRKLNVVGEDRLAGRGVSYCSTCDGYLFKDGKDVLVVGGGNSALTDAIYLESIGANVTIIHRGDSFRAEDRLQKTLRQNENITVRLNCRVAEILGETAVQKVVIEDTSTSQRSEMVVDGIFISIGYEPNNELADKLGLKLDKTGYIRTDPEQKTALPFVYAAGDVTGGIKQITVAVGQGSIAAISAFNDLKGK